MAWCKQDEDKSSQSNHVKHIYFDNRQTANGAYDVYVAIPANPIEPLTLNRTATESWIVSIYISYRLVGNMAR